MDELANVVRLLPDNKKVVLNKLDMYQDEDDKRMVLDLRACDGQQEDQIVRRFEQFRQGDSEEPYYRVTRGTTTMTTGDYPHEGTIRVEIGKEPEQK